MMTTSLISPSVREGTVAVLEMDSLTTPIARPTVGSPFPLPRILRLLDGSQPTRRAMCRMIR